MSNNVLIVEDDAAMLRGLHDNFRASGYAVRTAADGDRGLRLAIEAPRGVSVLRGEVYDAIVEANLAASEADAESEEASEDTSC